MFNLNILAEISLTKWQLEFNNNNETELEDSPPCKDKKYRMLLLCEIKTQYNIRKILYK